MQGIDIVFYIVILIMSVVIHEVSHGYAAERFGDKTARYAGRLTLNPLKHLDMFGSIILPLLLVVTKANFLIGWAKPVPYNPDNLTNRRMGTLAVAFAGILANLTIAVIFAVVIRVAMYYGVVYEPLYFIAGLIVFMNILLAFFNLMPFPPLDGSKILFAFLPLKFQYLEEVFERYAIVIFLIFIFFIWEYLSPAVIYIFKLLVGNSALLF
jgi:Zn-dependent protease